MNRIFRKHGKIILAILGVFLMIIFVLPFYTRSGFNTSAPVGYLDGKKITYEQLSSARSELELLKYFGVNPPVDDREPATHWFLLNKEAAKYGFTNIGMSKEQVEQELERGGLPPSMLDEVLQKANTTHRSLEAAFSHYQAVMRYIEFAATYPRPISSVELAGDRLLAKVQVEYATIDGSANSQSQPEPTDDQIKKQFDAYKDVVAGTSTTSQPPEINGHRYPFGYKYPDRVAVEWLVFNRDFYQAKMKPGPDDYQEAYKYYREHPNDPQFKNPEKESELISTQPATRPFAAVQEELVTQMIRSRVEKLLGRVADRAKNIAFESWRNVTVDAKGFREPLAAEKWVPYAKVADDISKNREFEGFKPEYHASEGLLGQEELAKLPGIGKAFYKAPNQGDTYTFPDLVTHVRDLVDLSAKDPMRRLFLQHGVDGPLLQDADGNFYLYRVTRVEKSHAPATMDEVKGKVVEDLKKIAAYEQAQKQGKDLAVAAKGADLITIAADRKVPAERTEEFDRLRPRLPANVDQVHDFVQTAFGLTGSTPTTTQPTTLPVESRSVATLPDDALLKVFVLQLYHVAPTSPAEFGQVVQVFGMQPGGLSQILGSSPEEGSPIAREYLSLDALAQRLHYKPESPWAPAKEAS